MATGKVVQVIGTVVDVEFPPGQLPALLNAIEIQIEGGKIVFEVQQHIGNNSVRCLAMAPTDGLARGAEAVDTGAPLKVPAVHLVETLYQPPSRLPEPLYLWPFFTSQTSLKF